MKSLVKNIALGLTLSSAAVAATVLISKEEVNKKVAALTAPYNNDTTKMSLKFTDLNVDEVRTLNFGVQAQVSKVGANNKAELTISNISYVYGNGINPTVTAKLALKTDLVKLLGQESINAMVADFQEVAKSLVSEHAAKYGDAVKVKAVVDNLTQDPNGNVSSARIRVTAALDFNKLPGDIAIEEVEFKKFDITLSATKDGVSGSAKLVLNPWHQSYKADQKGLREYVLALLSDDSEAYEEVSLYLELADLAAEWIVNTEPPTEGAQ